MKKTTQSKPIHDHVSQLLKELVAMVEPGLPTKVFLNYADEYIKQNTDIKSYNKGYKPDDAPAFPNALCLSINDVIAHGIPDPEYILKEGDTVNFDIGIQAIKSRQCGDAGLTVGVGKIADYNQKLIDRTKEALYLGIDEVKAGVCTCKVSAAIEKHARKFGYMPNHRFTGHGINLVMHEPPMVFNFTPPGQCDGLGQGHFIMTAGQKLCIEPIISWHDPVGLFTKDYWTVKTRDGRNSAMFEHMVQVTKTGCDILTTHITRG